jgi:16S rRNA (guanine527-N7)-methyltransferase
LSSDIDIGGLNVSRETFAKLEAFSALVQKWTPKINLVAKSSVSDIWQRHVVDSVQLYQFAPETYETWVDLGSGGGFPGIVMAIVAREKHPYAKFTLVESDQRKAVFLRTAARELNLNAVVLAERIEAIAPLVADVVSARALTALSGLLSHVDRHMSPSGVCILHKGKQAAQEIADAEASWQFELEDHASITDPEARLLVIQRILRRGNKL